MKVLGALYEKLTGVQKRALRILAGVALLVLLPSASRAQKIYDTPCLFPTIPLTQFDGVNVSNGHVNAGACINPSTGVITWQGNEAGGSESIINLTVTGNAVVKSFQNVQIVDTANAQGWPGSDIGAWINAAYAALPATGGAIDIYCSPTLVANFSTPIVFNVSNKYVKLRGKCTASAPSSGGGVVLNYTPTTATIAMTFDYTPAGGGGYTPGNGMEGVILTGNGCITNGGCGSAATGVQFGNTNAGAHAADFTNVRISGFGTGMSFNDTVGWGVTLNNFWLSWNTTGLTFPQLQEQIHWLGGGCVVNGTCINSASNSDVFVYGVSIDSNTTVGYTGIANFTCTACHFENLGTSNGQYITMSGGKVVLFGGLILDDTNVGTLTQMVTMTAGFFNMVGVNLFSGGRTATNIVNNTGGGTAYLDYSSSSPSLFPSNCSTTTACRGPALRGQVVASTTLLAANSCGDTVTVTINGANTSMSASASGVITTGLVPFAWVSSANTVSVQYCNVTVAGITPGASTLQVTVTP